MKLKKYNKFTSEESAIAGGYVEDYEDGNKVGAIYDEVIKTKCNPQRIDYVAPEGKVPKKITQEEKEMRDKVIGDKMLHDLMERKKNAGKIKLSFQYPTYDELKNVDMMDFIYAPRHKRSKTSAAQIFRILTCDMFANTKNFDEEIGQKLVQYAGFIVAADILSANIKNAFEKHEEYFDVKKLQDLKIEVVANMTCMEEQTKVCEKVFYEALRVNDSESICEHIKDDERKLVEMTLCSHAMLKEYVSFNEKAKQGIKEVGEMMRCFKPIVERILKYQKDEELQKYVDEFMEKCPKHGLKDVMTEHDPMFCSFEEMKKIVKVMDGMSEVCDRDDEVVRKYTEVSKAPIKHINQMKEDFEKHAKLEGVPQTKYVLSIYGKEPKVDIPKL